MQSSRVCVKLTFNKTHWNNTTLSEPFQILIVKS